jgi:hypothetical protein
MAGPADWEGMLIPHALRAISEGQSANAFVQALRESGAGVRRQVALRIYGEARALAAEYANEPSRPINAVPTLEEARQWPTRASEGILQTVQLFYRERVTGNIIQRFYNVKTENGITREEAIRRAADANVENARRYQQELVGAVHTGTAILVATSVA